MIGSLIDISLNVKISYTGTFSTGLFSTANYHKYNVCMCVYVCVSECACGVQCMFGGGWGSVCVQSLCTVAIVVEAMDLRQQQTCKLIKQIIYIIKITTFYLSLYNIALPRFRKHSHMNETGRVVEHSRHYTLKTVVV